MFLRNITGHGCDSHQLHKEETHFDKLNRRLRAYLECFPNKVLVKRLPIMRRRRYRRPQPKIVEIPKARVNEQIRVPFVFLVDADGSVSENMPTEQAIARAREQELDLVEVSPKADPPVCKVLDYGKYLYAEGKKEQQAKSKQKKVETKGIRIRLRTDTHDLEFKRAQAEKFLSRGHKVKIEIILRGRERASVDRAKETLKGFMDSVKATFGVEEDIKRFPGGLHIIIAPK